jgi:hypothetical protein
MEKGTTYYWRSPKDGMYYAVKLINNNHKLKKNNIRIVGWSHPGYLSKHRKEADGGVITLHIDNSPTHTDLHLLLIEDIMQMVRSGSSLEFPDQLAMLQELREFLEEHPDKYLKYMDILARNKLFDGILEGKYDLKELPRGNSSTLYQMIPHRI